ncbi:hypothetical protein SAMN05421636_102113 [Pricia antarctica]|uniref:Lipoprotein n=1 Tax=Pricia antarctica TaxID=641691 RepID=A0A1G6Y6U4_9FLAO|nr:hypothetical protein [Pricia antarctica]SDD85315.1 hypothetical protein SAMN05421636_102113 [Pricia antarctica]
MGKYIFIGVIAGLIMSCERTECCVNPNLELQGRFTHELPNCDNGDNPEINCIEWLEFINENEVDISYGGIDVVRRFDYVIKDSNVLYLEGPPTSSFKGRFKIMDLKTLVRLDAEDIWKKAE